MTRAESKDKRKEPHGITRPDCEYCPEKETERHLFVQCQHFKKVREKSSKEIQQLTKKAIEKAMEDDELTLTENQLELLRYAAEQVLTDGSTWKDDECRSWLGFTPSTDHIFTQSDNIAQAKLIKRLHDGWHYTAVRMVGYIWGARQQQNWKT